MFYKRFVAVFATIALTLCAVLMSTQILFAKANAVDEQDTAFLEFVREDTGLEQIDYTSIQLYDDELSPNGKQYVFTVGGVSGYALTSIVRMGEQQFYEVEELFYNTPAPFTTHQGLPVYFTFQTYLDYVDGEFYDLANNRAVVLEETINELASKGFGYRGNSSGDYTTSSETINYSTKSVETDSFPNEVPDITGAPAGTCCANVAGAIIIGYYDRYFENLIPNYQAYNLFLGTIVYKSFSVELETLTQTLSSYMAVDGLQLGTTFTGFQQGMERYVEEHGYTYSASSLIAWGALHLETYKYVIQQGMPVAIFLNGFSISGVAEGNNQDSINNSTYVATHVLVGLGYKFYTYYDASGNVVANRNFLKVASGLVSYGIGYLNISSNAGGSIVSAIAIDIN